MGEWLLGTYSINWDKAIWRSRVFRQVAFTVAFHLFLVTASGYLARVLYARPQQSKGFWETVALNFKQWDARWFLEVAQKGYESKSAAFFPLYPMLIRTVSRLDIDPVWAGLLISNVAFAAACILFYKLVRLDYDDDVSLRALWYMALFPTAFYFFSIYSESLYLVMVLAAFYAGRQGNWVAAGFFAMLAALTRNLGVFMMAPLFYEYMAGIDFDRRRIRADILGLLLIPVGTALYCFYLWRVLGDPLAFFKAQSYWGRELHFPWVAVYRALVYINQDFYLGRHLLDLIFTLLGLASLVYSFFRLRRSYFWFVAFGLLVPLSSPAPMAALMSMPRFVLVLFPIYIMMALEVRKPVYQNALTSIMSGLLVYLNVMFSFSRWVA